MGALARRTEGRVLVGLLIALAGMAMPCAASAQPVPTIGFLCADSCTTLPGGPIRPIDSPFVKGLELSGYVLGRNIAVDSVAVGVGHDRLGQAAEGLVKRGVRVIVAVGNAEARAARKATALIPIVMVDVVAPVENGLIASFGRPGGNVTGLAVPFEELAIKHVELLKEMQPRLARVAILWNPELGLQKDRLGRLEAGARALGVATYPVRVTAVRDLEEGFRSLPARPEGLVALEHVTTVLLRPAISMFALQHRLPSVAGDRQFVSSSGGLMAYGPRLADQYERAAIYVAKLLKGAHPRELPVEEPTRFELIISRTTARALGLAIPSSLLVRADEIMD